MKKLGKLKAIKLKDWFSHEAHEFTPWLAEESNLQELATALGMELELQGTEVQVGPYRADIVARDGSDLVVIENQFGRTDHDHLGKAIIYAAGLHAKAIVWIADEFSDDHRRAFDFLNEVTTDNLRLYGIEMRLFQIGDSVPAPQFQVVVRPTEYNKPPGPIAGTDTQQLYVRFWAAWRDFVKGSPKAKIRPTKPLPQHWSSMSIGKSGFSLDLTVSVQKRRIGCEIYLGGALANTGFDQLIAEREAIEEITGELEWMPLKEKQACRIVQFKHDVDVGDEASWPEIHAWLLQHAQALNRGFRPRVKKLDLSVPTVGMPDLVGHSDDPEAES